MKKAKKNNKSLVVDHKAFNKILDALKDRQLKRKLKKFDETGRWALDFEKIGFKSETGKRMSKPNEEQLEILKDYPAYPDKCNFDEALPNQNEAPEDYFVGIEGPTPEEDGDLKPGESLWYDTENDVVNVMVRKEGDKYIWKEKPSAPRFVIDIETNSILGRLIPKTVKKAEDETPAEKLLREKGKRVSYNELMSQLDEDDD